MKKQSSLLESSTTRSSSPLGPSAQHTDEWYKFRKIFFVLLVLWLVALPLATMVQFVAQFFLRDTAASQVVVPLVNILSILVGLFGVLGWVPVLIVGILWSQKK